MIKITVDNGVAEVEYSGDVVTVGKEAAQAQFELMKKYATEADEMSAFAMLRVYEASLDKLIKEMDIADE